MKTIPSFEVDHTRLARGIFVSRRDQCGSTELSTFDIRMKEPNREPVMDVPALHSIEHLAATILRNDPDWGGRIVYFGPMGCRTGYYLIVEGRLESSEIAPLVQNLFQSILDWQEAVPGSSPACCGNYLDHNLNMAKYEAAKFQREVLLRLAPENLHYPEPIQ